MDVKAYVIKRETSRNGRVSVVYPLRLIKVRKFKKEKYIWDHYRFRFLVGNEKPEGIYLKKRNLLTDKFDDGIKRWYCIFKDEDLQ